MTHLLLLASENPGKLSEFQSLLGGQAFRLVTPLDLGLHLDVSEDGQTYAENAALKAQAYCHASGLPALADDSGLEVDALDGRPGIYSHRLAAKTDATDADRRALLLALLHGKPRPWRAHFHCTVAIAMPDGRVTYAEGDCQGEIIPEERGTHGFGYDPVFFLPEKDATMAELDDAVKNQVSHRWRAIQAALPTLRELFP